MKNNQPLKVPSLLNGISPKDRSQYYDGLVREVAKMIPADVFFVLCLGTVVSPNSFNTSVLGNANKELSKELLDAVLNDMCNHSPTITSRPNERN